MVKMGQEGLVKGVLKNGNLLHKWGLVETQLLRTVSLSFILAKLWLNSSPSFQLSYFKTTTIARSKKLLELAFWWEILKSNPYILLSS